MQRRIRTLTFLFAALLALCACGNSKGGGTGGVGGVGGAGGEGGQGGTVGAGGDGGEGGTGGAGGDGGQGGSGGSGGEGGQGGDGGTGGSGPKGIAGRVVDEDGEPIHGALVALNHDFAGAMATRGDGSFAFEDVEGPYRLTVVADGMLREFAGLTTPTPIVAVSDALLAPVSIGIMAGKVEGLKLPIPSDESVILGSNGTLGLSIAETSGTFSDWRYWGGVDERRVSDFAALHLAVGGSCVSDFLGFGKLPNVALKNGDTVDDLVIPVGEKVIPSVEATIRYESKAYTLRQVVLNSFIVEGIRFQVPCFLPTTLGTTIIPSEGAVFLWQGRDDDGNEAIYAKRFKGQETLSLWLPDSSEIKPVLPTDGATAVPTTPTLRWAAPHRARLQIVRIWKNSTSRNVATIVVPGNEGTLSLPDYAPLGHSLEAGTTYQWQVTAINTPLSPDGLLEGKQLDLLHEGLILLADDLERFDTKRQSFTTAP